MHENTSKLLTVLRITCAFGWSSVGAMWFAGWWACCCSFAALYLAEAQGKGVTAHSLLPANTVNIALGRDVCQIIQKKTHANNGNCMEIVQKTAVNSAKFNAAKINLKLGL